MGESQHTKKRAIRATLHKILLNYVEKDPEANLVKLADRISSLFGGLFPPENFEKMKRVAADKDNVWHRLALSILSDLDRNVIEQMLVSLGIDAGYYGTKAVQGKP